VPKPADFPIIQRDKHVHEWTPEEEL